MIKKNKPPVVILAAGASSRFYPFNQQHKSYTRIAGAPLLYQTLQNVADHGFKEVHIVVSPDGYQKGSFYEYLQQQPITGLKVNFHLQDSPLGQGNAIQVCTDQIINDCIIGSPYYTNLGELADQLLEAVKQDKADGGIWVSHTDHPHEYGIASLEADKYISQIIEKPRQPDSNWRVNSLYYVNSRLLDILWEEVPLDDSFERALSVWAIQQDVLAYKGEEIGSLKYPWHLLDYSLKILDSLSSYTDSTADIHPTAVLDEAQGAIHIDKNVRVGAFTRIVGPTYIGPDAIVGDHSLIRSSSLESHAAIGAQSEVARSLVGSGSSAHDCYIADSVIGENVSIGAGLTTANKRLDRESIYTKVKKVKTSTARNRLGAIIGDRAKLGIQVGTMPGVIIAPESEVMPQTCVAKNT